MCGPNPFHICVHNSFELLLFLSRFNLKWLDEMFLIPCMCHGHRKGPQRGGLRSVPLLFPIGHGKCTAQQHHCRNSLLQHHQDSLLPLLQLPLLPQPPATIFSFLHHPQPITTRGAEASFKGILRGPYMCVCMRACEPAYSTMSC